MCVSVRVRVRVRVCVCVCVLVNIKILIISIPFQYLYCIFTSQRVLLLFNSIHYLFIFVYLIFIRNVLLGVLFGNTFVGL